MKTAGLLILSLIQKALIIEAVTTNKTVTSYDPAELLSQIFKPNVSLESRQRGYGFVKFEDQFSIEDDQDQYGFIEAERDPKPLKFEDDYDSQNLSPNGNDQNTNGYKPLRFEDTDSNLDTQDGGENSNGGVTFQDDNKVDNQGNKRKRRRRRRKPKNGVLPYYPAANGVPERPGYQGLVPGGYGLHLNSNLEYPIPGATQPFRRPRRPRPRPSIASEALSSVTEALTSIARYDDYQCVPRLLCEAAGGGALGSSGVLQSIAGIQPLLTLLSAYNGISASPLFVFGRAVFLGMTSKGNTGTCRYGYPQCPTDPEQLIHYLNNHNGGFFRFFSAPQLPNQNVEQLYNQLSQGFGIHQPNLPNYGQQNDPSYGQNYGYPNDQNSAQHYGLHSSQYQEYPRPGYDGTKFGPYYNNNNNQNYGPNYAYDYNNYASGNQIKFKDSDRIQKRIQNKPAQNVADDNFDYDDVKTKWQFPDDTSNSYYSNHKNVRDSRTLKFPEESQAYQAYDVSKERNGKRMNLSNNQINPNYYDNYKHTFPNNNRYETTTYSYNNGYYSQNYNNDRGNLFTNNNNYKNPVTKYYNYDYKPNHSSDNYNNNNFNNQNNIYNNNKYAETVFNNEEYVFDYKHNFYVKKEKEFRNIYNNNFKRNEDDGLNTVYVVRGNGDPNKPEIVKLRPGQTVN